MRILLKTFIYFITLLSLSSNVVVGQEKTNSSVIFYKDFEKVDFRWSEIGILFSENASKEDILKGEVALKHFNENPFVKSKPRLVEAMEIFDGFREVWATGSLNKTLLVNEDDSCESRLNIVNLIELNAFVAVKNKNMEEFDNLIFNARNKVDFYLSLEKNDHCRLLLRGRLFDIYRIGALAALVDEKVDTAKRIIRLAAIELGQYGHLDNWAGFLGIYSEILKPYDPQEALFYDVYMGVGYRDMPKQDKLARETSSMEFFYDLINRGLSNYLYYKLKKN